MMKFIVMFCLVLTFATATVWAQKKVLYMVQINLYDGSRVKGVLGTLRDSSIQVLGYGKKFSGKILVDSSKVNVTINVATIQSLGYRNVKAPSIGAGIGLLAGVLGSFAVGSNTEECDPNSLSGPICEANEGADQLVKEVLVMCAGAGLGFAIGSAYKKVEIGGRQDNFMLFRERISKR